MRLFDDPLAPNCRRVRIFLAEKGVDIPRETVEIAKKQHKTEEYRQINPLALVPALELDDGRRLCESVAICRYVEEALQPEPNLFGAEPFERAKIEQWQRHMEFEILLLNAQVFRNTHPFWQGRIPQAPDYGEMCRKASAKRYEWLNNELANREYIAGDRFSIADITALVGIDFGRISNIRIQPEQTHLQRWYDAVSSRPSAKA
ncbi:MAG: glutathione S-transferase family protein [Candidatus Dadabacteria bacterium]|nr:MAG: glutathione S-transferase family protein [Candidatus Dadabacteria bacterium]